jgi:uncharacterized protein YjaZ
LRSLEYFLFSKDLMLPHQALQLKVKAGRVNGNVRRLRSHNSIGISMVKNKNINLIFVILSFTFGCQTNAIELERTTFVVHNQQIQLVRTDSLFDWYLKKQNISDYTAASNEFLYGPIQKEILDNAEAPFMFETIRAPYQQGTHLEKEIALLKSTDLTGLVKEALDKITSSLPGPDTKIIIMPANPMAHDLFEKYNICMNAITVGSGKIIIQIDPTFPQWKQTLPYVIAHEYHHSTWISRNWKNADFSVLEYLIFEGRADAFATSLYPNVLSPWTTMITKEEENIFWNKIKDEIFQRGHERINKVMFGDHGISFGSGYTIGFNIVQSFKRTHPDVTDKSMIDMSPDDIFKQCKYK